MIEVVPFLLGFHPSDSVVVVGLHGSSGRVTVALRADLEHARRDAGFAEAAAGLLSERRTSRRPTEAAVVLVYASAAPDRPVPEAPVSSRVVATLEAAGVAVVEALYVGAGRWCSYLCVDRRCCPRGGRPLPATGGTTSPVTAAATFAGLVTYPDRAALASSLRAPEAAGRGPMHGALRRAAAAAAEAVATGGEGPSRRAAWRGVQAAARHAAEIGPGDDPSRSRLGLDQYAAVLVAVLDPRLRARCWRQVDRFPEDWLPLWRQLVPRAGPPHDVAPAFLLAWAAWRRGDGVLARVAAERALASDPADIPSKLLTSVLDRGVDPASLPPLGSAAGRPTAPARVSRRRCGGGAPAGRRPS